MYTLYMALEASRAVVMIIAHDYGRSTTGKAKVSYYYIDIQLQRCSGGLVHNPLSWRQVTCSVLVKILEHDT